MSVTTINIEWRGDGSSFSVFVGDTYAGSVYERPLEVEFEPGVYYVVEETYFAAARGGADIPGRFVYRGEAIAALVTSMSPALLAAECYVER